MTPEVEAKRAELFKELAATGSPQARNDLVESFAPLAEFFAKRYRKRGAEDEDLRQVAQLALVKAVDRFDHTMGVQFSTFAGRTIDGELKRYFRDRTWSVRVPRGLQELSIEARKAADELAHALGRPATVDELATRLDVEPDLVIEALDVQTAYRAQSLDQPRSDGEESLGLSSRLGDIDAGFERTEVAMAVGGLLEKLPERERRILELRFFENMSQSDIAEEVGISQMHVSRLIRRSLESLRSHLR